MLSKAEIVLAQVMAGPFEVQPTVETLYVLEHIHDNYNVDHRIGPIAKRFGLHVSTLGGKFKNDTDITFQKCMQRKRCYEAAKLLLHTDMTLTRIANEVGYKTHDALNRPFKEFYGYALSEYRERKVEDALTGTGGVFNY